MERRLLDILCVLNRAQPEGLGTCTLVSGTTPDEIMEDVLYQYSKLCFHIGKIEPKPICPHCFSPNAKLINYIYINPNGRIVYRCQDCDNEYQMDDTCGDGLEEALDV